jgi:short-subunit dehydrogenase
MSNSERQEVVVVTGGSAGVGRAVARAFGKEGASVGLIARGRDDLESAKSEIEELGGRALVLPTDVANSEQVEAAADRVEKELGPIGVWVNNAMATVFSRFLEITPEEFKRSTEVTYLGTVYGTMAALKRMYARDRGTIVQVGSALAYRSIPLQAPYCGAKHAIAGFTDSVRTELIHEKKNIHLTMVQLPAMNTPQFSWSRTKLPRHPQPVPPIFEPEVAADAIVWAARQRRREVWVGAPTIAAIEGQKIAPGMLDRYLGSNGYDSQQTGEPVDPHRPDNLFHALSGDWGAHGIFSSRAHKYSPQTWATMHRNWLIAGLGIAGVAGAAMAIHRKSSETV